MRWRTAVDAASPASFHPVKATMSTGERSVGRDDHWTCSIARTLSAWRPPSCGWGAGRSRPPGATGPSGGDEGVDPGAQLALRGRRHVGPGVTVSVFGDAVGKGRAHPLEP